MSPSCVCAAGGATDPGAEVDGSTSDREEEEADEEEAETFSCRSVPHMSSPL